MEDFRIDPEFQNKIPPIGEDEFRQLRENILEAGEVYEPLVVWDGVLVDGHNRWKVIQERPEIKWRVREMHFADKWAAFEWMYKNQLGRRNLTDEQRTYTIGKMYEARKKSITNETGRNQYTKVVEDQNDLQPKPKSTAEAIGREVGVAEPSVKRWEKFAQGVDALREVSPEAADKVLSGRANVTKKDVAGIARMDEDAQKEAARRIEQGEPVKDAREKPKGKSGNSRGWTKEDRANRALTREVIARTHSDEVPEYTLDMLVEDLKLDADNYFSALEWRLSTRPELVSASAQYIDKLIDDYIINGIKEIRRRIA